MDKIRIILLLICSPFALMAGGSEGGSGETGIEWVAQGAREVEPAYRIALSPKVIDTNIAAETVNYPLLVLKYDTQTKVDEINPATINIKDQLPQLYNSYAKLGVGSELMPLGEFYFSATRSRKFNYGAHVKHLSSFGNLKGFAPAQFDRTGGVIFGAINEKRYTLKGDVRYRNQGLHYYGVSDTLGLTRDSISQRYSDFGFSAMYGWHKKDSAKLNFNAGIDYNNFMSRKPEDEQLKDWRARENYFAVNTNAWYKHGKEVYAADFNVRYNGYRYGTEGDTLTATDTAIVLNNTVVNLKPTITTRLKDNRFKAKIGLDLTIDAHNKTKAYVFPVAELKYSMFNDIFIPYVGLDGGLTQRTFKSTTQENEFILPNLALRNQVKSIELYGGIKGTLSKRVGFNTSISFSRIKDMAFFVTDTMYSIGNKFGLIYDTLNLTTIEGSLSYQLTEKIKVDGTARFYSYDVFNNSYAWNMPRLQFVLRGSYNLFDKFLFNLDLNLEEGRKALVYGDGTGVTEENGQYIKNLGFIADANLSVEYRYNKRISAFVQLNNFAAQRYSRWYNYPVQRFQGLGGVTFRF